MLFIIWLYSNLSILSLISYFNQILVSFFNSHLRVGCQNIDNSGFLKCKKKYCFHKKALYSRGGIKITVLRNTQPFEKNPFMEKSYVENFRVQKIWVQKIRVQKIRVLKIRGLQIRVHTKCCLTASFYNWLTW